MRKVLLTILLFVVFMPQAFAHGGFEKSAENTTVYINQIPASPLVGEKVDFTFQFRDPTVLVDKDLSVKNLSNIPVQISLIDTYYGDESKDKKVFSKKFMTDENGNISFSYTFPKENYYDIEFSYKDHNGISQETGYLVQPRNSSLSVPLLSIFPVLVGGLLLGFLISVKLNS